YAESRPETPQRAQTKAGKLLRCFDSTPRTTSPQGQTAAPQNLQLDRLAKILLPSRDGHAVKQIISECSPALPGLFKVVSEAMCHDCHSHGLDVFGRSISRPCISAQACAAWSNASPARGDSPVIWRCREASSRSCR